MFRKSIVFLSIAAMIFQSGASFVLAAEESVPALTFAQAEVTVGEGTGPQDIEVALSAAATTTVTFDLSVAVGISSAGVKSTDYEYIAGSFTIPQGETAATFEDVITIPDDEDGENEERVVFKLSNVSGATASNSINPEDHLTVIIPADFEPTQLQFATPSSTVIEGEGAAVVISIAEAVVEPVTFSLARHSDSTAKSTKTPGQDIVVSAWDPVADVVIPAGATSTSVSFSTIDDALVEGNETLVLDVSSSTNAIFDGGRHTITIIDNDTVVTPTVGFASSSVQVNEPINTDEIGRDIVPIAFTGERTSSTVLTFEVINATATPNEDFVLQANDRAVPAGVTSTYYAMDILADNVVEHSETVTIQLVSASGGVEIDKNNDTFELTILPDETDIAPVLSFSAPSSTVVESVGTTTIPVMLSATSTQAVAFTIGRVEDGQENLVTSTDYGFAQHAYTIPAGEIGTHVLVNIEDDSNIEQTELLKLRIGGLENAAFGETVMHDLYISDNDEEETGNDTQPENTTDTSGDNDTNAGGNTGGSSGGGGAPPNQAPSAAFDVSGDMIANTAVSFDATISEDADNNIRFWIWNFGDGSDEQTGVDDPKIAHTFTQTGEYDVSLTVKDSGGATDTVSKNVVIDAVQTEEESGDNVTSSDEEDVVAQDADEAETAAGVALEGNEPSTQTQIAGDTDAAESNAVDTVTQDDATQGEGEGGEDDKQISTSTAVDDQAAGGDTAGDDAAEQLAQTDVVEGDDGLPGWLRVLFGSGAVAAVAGAGIWINRMRNMA